MGELAVIFGRDNQFLAIGLYDSESPIRIRVLHCGKAQTIDSQWWNFRLEETCFRRIEVASALTNGLRWINGESDGWPGLVLDQYDRTLVLKLYSATWFTYLELLLKLIQSRLNPERVVIRLSRNIQAWAEREKKPRDGVVVAGSSVPGPVAFLESGISFLADVTHGQKTGFFLDQRENRRRVETMAKGADVLNLFSFSGGFSLYAARGGAKSVTSVDISGYALRELEKNWELNKRCSAIHNCAREEVQADVFKWLQSAQKQYDVIIIDPPSLAKKEKDRAVAIRTYRKLAKDGIRLLNKGGSLVCASCSAHVSALEFVEAVRSAVRESGRSLKELEVTGHAPDHPASLPEMHYLKAVYLRDRS